MVCIAGALVVGLGKLAILHSQSGFVRPAAVHIQMPLAAGALESLVAMKRPGGGCASGVCL